MDSHSKPKTKQRTTKTYDSDDSADIPLQKKRKTAVSKTESDDDVPLRKAVDKALVTKKELEASQATAALAKQESDRIDELLKSISAQFGSTRVEEGPREEDTIIDKNLTRYRESREELCNRLAVLSQHSEVLLDHACDFTDLTELVLGSLDTTYRVKRLSIEEFGPPEDYENLVDQLMAASEPSEVSEVGKMLRIAIFIDAGILVNKLRLGLTGLAEKADEMGHKLDATVPRTVAEGFAGGHGAVAELDSSKRKVIEIYYDLLESFCSLLAETKPCLELLEDQFAEEPGTSKMDDHVKNSRERSDCIRRVMKESQLRIEQIAQKGLMGAEPEQFHEEWMRIRRTLGGPLARAVIDEYPEVSEAYEAVFVTAAKLAPEVFEHLRP
ncbi:hypothetical protein LTS10_002073 [Elasticomyces elasticus]|nr:hypothetical protein LTS10_002073 [Elasticomyces elasticus]